MEIKICGIKTVEDIQIINKYNIHYAGFIFAKGSKREVSPQLAKELIKNLNSNIKSVGVFTYTPIEKINQIANYCNLDIVQLHSNETDDDIKRSNKITWKSVSVKSYASLNQIAEYKCANGILLDTYKQNALGGTGESFDWNLVKGLSQKYFVILAGGLDENNINQAIKIVNPQVVDICSGAETNGFKDENKIKNLVRRIENEI